MPEILVQAPSGEPINLADAKLHLRVTDDGQDAIIRSMLAGARQAAEQKTRQQLLHARYQYIIDRFPVPGAAPAACGVVSIPPSAIVLPRAPVVDVVKVEYLDMAGELQTLDASVYTVQNAMLPGIITPRFGEIWPVARPESGAVRVTYNAGYASPVSVVAASSGTFRISGPVSYPVGAVVQFYNSGGALPAGLQAQTNYLIGSAMASVYTLTDLEGVPVVFTDNGSGSNFIGVVPEGLRNWILIRLGSLYENREEVAFLTRGGIKELPFIDGLLDPYRISLP
ncbi:phage head-tail connector protein [Cupriavidus sp. KK10]|uniref:head-tail connector protein n=1 Tax=Cupriavidus sp. KK10 TaxID=1478019 RepID=UPI001BAD2BCA|nr:phage head-tail connector protein [Cupriavidus sp. KK10]QUN28709.1 phage head-tail connector protein [Cupriavidus sp. KK10]